MSRIRSRFVQALWPFVSAALLATACSDTTGPSREEGGISAPPGSETPGGTAAIRGSTSPAERAPGSEIEASDGRHRKHGHPDQRRDRLHHRLHEGLLRRQFGQPGGAGADARRRAVQVHGEQRDAACVVPGDLLVVPWRNRLTELSGIERMVLHGPGSRPAKHDGVVSAHHQAVERVADKQVGRRGEHHDLRGQHGVPVAPEREVGCSAGDPSHPYPEPGEFGRTRWRCLPLVPVGLGPLTAVRYRTGGALSRPSPIFDARITDVHQPPCCASPRARRPRSALPPTTTRVSASRPRHGDRGPGPRQAIVLLQRTFSGRAAEAPSRESFPSGDGPGGGGRARSR